eukprot:4703574-Prymnesium_polylepis.1
MSTNSRGQPPGLSAPVDVTARAYRGREAKVSLLMTSLVGTVKHVSTPSRKIVIRHTMSRPYRGRVASVS